MVNVLENIHLEDLQSIFHASEVAQHAMSWPSMRLRLEAMAALRDLLTMFRPPPSMDEVMDRGEVLELNAADHSRLLARRIKIAKRNYFRDKASLTPQEIADVQEEIASIWSEMQPKYVREAGGPNETHHVDGRLYFWRLDKQPILWYVCAYHRPGKISQQQIEHLEGSGYYAVRTFYADPFSSKKRLGKPRQERGWMSIS